MAHELIGLGHLASDELDILLSSLSEKHYPIEINGKKYIIPKKVGELIDSLADELENIRYGDINGIS